VKKEKNMLFYKKILFPVDLSEASPRIATHVNEIADKFGAEVHIIYVAHVSDYYHGIYLPSPYMVNFEREVIKAAKKQLQEFQTANFKDRPVKANVLSGDPDEAILYYVQAKGIDLIVMGHSRKGIKRLMMGSVAAHVVKKSLIPVLIVNPHGMKADDAAG
jgi:nucleotide-binding universal stress UspA family protein